MSSFRHQRPSEKAGCVETVEELAAGLELCQAGRLLIREEN